MEKKNNKGLIILIVFLVLVVIGLASFVVINKLNNSDSKTIETVDPVNELEEVDAIYYEDLMDQLMYKTEGCFYDILDKNYTINNIPDEYIFKTVAKNYADSSPYYKVDEATARKLLYIDENESYETFKEEYNGGLLKGIPSKNIKKGAKKTFNKEINKLPSSIRLGWSYIKNLDAYIYARIPGEGAGDSNSGIITYKAEKKGDELYLYNKIYFESSQVSDGLYDYGQFKYDSNKKIVFDSNTKPVEVNGKVLKSVDDIKQNLDKFTTYKFTFKLIDGNYIYQKFEKM